MPSDNPPRDAGAALGRLACPSVMRWNWKTALMSALIRGGLFFATNLTVSLAAAWRALFVSLLLSVPMAGIVGAMIQEFRFVEPVWVASLFVVVLLPAVTHIVEVAIHLAARTPALRASLMASVALSALTSAFDLFAVRRGLMVVGADGGPLMQDLRLLPSAIGAFVLAVPAGAVRVLSRRLR